MVFGVYQLYHRFPTLSDLAIYILLGFALAPVVAAAGWLLSARAWRRCVSDARGTSM
jgi:hypothetical protein